MTKSTLNKCLSKLDMIFTIIVSGEDVIFSDLEDIRKYVIDSYIEKTEREQQRLKDTVKVTIQFINYMIQDCLCGAITFNFLNRINALRQLILKIESGSVLLIDKEIDFDEECWTFINNYIKKIKMKIAMMKILKMVMMKRKNKLSHKYILQ